MDPNLLRTIPLLSQLDQADLDRLAVDFHRRSFPAGEVLFREGDPGDRFSILLSGQIEIIKALGSPAERRLAMLGPGDFLGEMSLLDPGRLRSASGRTLTALEWAEITPQSFAGFLERLPALSLRLMQEMNSRLRRSEADTIRDLQEKNQALTLAYQNLELAQAELLEKEKIERELEIARSIQQSILPKQIPLLPGWQIAASWQPARAVSGDFYDFFLCPDGRMGMLIADVSGKGVPAALVMAVACSILRSVTATETSPGAILARVNDLLCPGMPPHMFVTCLVAILDPADGNLHFANAGHNLPFMVTAEQACELRATGMPLGLLPGSTYIAQETFVEPGSGLLFYTDGMIEAHNSNQEMFGTGRLQAALAELPFSPDLIPHLLARLADFTGPGWEQEDDVTFVILAAPPRQSKPSSAG